MGRPITRISPDGFIRCPRCGEEKFIDQFYMQGGEYISIEVNGDETWFGKPYTYCISCTLDRERTRRTDTPLDRLNLEIGVAKRRLATLEADRAALLRELTIE